MVVAVTYDKETGNVGQHFGHADFFKLYEIELESKKIMDSAVVSPFGQGHDAVVATMVDYSVVVVICQNIGEGAINGLAEAGISVCPNVTGSADDAIQAFMDGTLQIQIVSNCDCHDGGSCCGGEDSGCGSGCGGCCH